MAWLGESELVDRRERTDGLGAITGPAGPADGAATGRRRRPRVERYFRGAVSDTRGRAASITRVAFAH